MNCLLYLQMQRWDIPKYLVFSEDGKYLMNFIYTTYYVTVTDALDDNINTIIIKRDEDFV